MVSFRGCKWLRYLLDNYVDTPGLWSFPVQENFREGDWICPQCFLAPCGEWSGSRQNGIRKVYSPENERMSPENQWLENAFPSPSLGDEFVRFGGVYSIHHTRDKKSGEFNGFFAYAHMITMNYTVL